MARAASNGLMEDTLRESLRMESCMDQACMCGRMAEVMKANTSRIRSMALEPTLTLTVASTKVTGLMECSMEMAASSTLNPPKSAQAAGSKANLENGTMLKQLERPITHKSSASNTTITDLSRLIFDTTQFILFCHFFATRSGNHTF